MHDIARANLVVVQSTPAYTEKGAKTYVGFQAEGLDLVCAILEIAEESAKRFLICLMYHVNKNKSKNLHYGLLLSIISLKK